MKKTLNTMVATVVIFFIIVHSANAQTPQKIPYQAVARNSAGTVIPNQNIKVRFSIRNNSSDGDILYQEIHTTTTSNTGLFNLIIGDGQTQSGSMNAIDWANGNKFIQVEFDPQGGNNFIDMGTQQLLSVPYALHAKTAESITGGGGPGNNGFVHYVGEPYGGGVVFHMWKDANGEEHGLVVSLNDIGEPFMGSGFKVTKFGICAEFPLGYTNSSWDGNINTQQLVNFDPNDESVPAKCLNLVSNGFDDWYLPSYEELAILRRNIFTVHKTLLGMPGADLMMLTPSEINLYPSVGVLYFSSTIANNQLLMEYFDSLYSGVYPNSEPLSCPEINYHKARAIRKY